MQVIIFIKKEMSVKFLAALLWPAMLLPILSHADSDIQTVSVSQAYADDATGCEQLYPVNSFESLFRQMAGTLHSACLLDMPPEDLAKKWQIPVYRRYVRLSGRLRPDGEKQAVLRWKDKAERQKWLKHRRRKLKRPTDGFTVVHQTDYDGSTFLEIEATPDYLKHYRSLFPDDRYPDDLPKPYVSSHILSPVSVCFNDGTRKNFPRYTVVNQVAVDEDNRLIGSDRHLIIREGKGAGILFQHPTDKCINDISSIFLIR